MNNPENLYLFLSNSASIYYIVTDLDGKYSYANNFFRKIFGYVDDYILTQRFKETIHEEDIPAFEETRKECFSNPGKTVCIDLRKPRADGSLFWTRWEFCTFFDADQLVAGLQAIGNDITERKRAELERQKAQENLQLLLNNTDESFLMVDRDLSIISYNRAAENLLFRQFGVHPKRGLPVLMFIRSHEYEKIEALYSRALLGESGHYESYFEKRKGEVEILSNSLKPVYNDEEAILGIIVTSTDITARKNAEEKLLSNERYFRTLIENSADAMTIIAPDGEIIDLSPSAERILGFSKDAMISVHCADIIHPEDLEYVNNTIQQVLSQFNSIYTIEYRVKTVSENYIWISGTYHNLVQEPDIRGVVINFNDITQRKEAEKALLVSEEKYRFLFFINPQPMWIYDVNTLRFVEVNASAVRHYGYSEEEFHAMTILDIRPGYQREMLNKRLIELNQHPGLSHSGKVWEHLTKNGDLLFVEIKSHYLEYNGRPAILVSVNDITRMVKAERQLIKSNERFQYAVKATSEAIWEWDIASGEFYIASAFTSMLGWPARANMKINDLHGYIHSDDQERVSTGFNNSLQNPEADLWQDEYRIRKSGGGFSYVTDRGWIIRDENGMPVKVVGSIRDMTESKQFEQELIKSKERFELAGKATSDAIWDADLVEDTIHWGDGFETLFGYKMAANVSSSEGWIEHIHPKDKDRVLERHNRIIYGEPSQAFWKEEYRFYRADGTIAHVIDKGIIIRDETGKAYRIIGAMQDITERKESEERLSRERYLLRTLIDHLPDYIYVKDTQLKHIINNKANVELIGAYSEEETLGKTVLDYFNKDVAKSYIDRDKEILKKGLPVLNEEEEVITRSGIRRWLLTTKVPLKNDREEVIGLVGISRDITERKYFEESLRKSNERYDIVSKATNDAIYDWDLVNGILQWNDVIRSLFGYHDNSLVTDVDWWVSRIHPDDLSRVMDSIDLHIKNRVENWQSEYRFACADGSYKYVFDRAFILLNNDRLPYRMIGAIMDITERKKLEEELASQEITRQRQITEATIQAQEKERSDIGRELHDNINQILTTTKLYIDMAINEKDIREELLTKSYNNVSAAIEEIRLLSRTLVPPSLGDIGIKEAISEMIGNLNVAQRLKIKLKTSGFTKVAISGNIKLMVFRIVQEQLNNVIKHSRASEVEIKLALSKKMLNITVRDNGIGFDPRKKTKGIGLNNITSRAELYKGQVDVITAPKKGCTLRVAIPI